AVDTVSLNSVLDGKLGDAFKVGWPAGDTSKRPIAIVITTSPDRVQKQGSYDVVITVTVTKTSERASLTATATRAAGTLTVPPLLKFDRTRNVPFSSEGENAPARLVATETSKNTPVVIKPPAYSSGASDDAERPGTLRLAGKEITIKPGEQHDVPFETTGKFPLGTTTGSLVIPSDQLAAPLVAAYEVRTRLNPYYIFGIVFAGLVVSWFVKGKLQDDIDRAAVEVRVNELLTHMASVRSRHIDPSLESAVSEQTGALTLALTTKTPAEIEDRRKTLETAFQAALDALPGKRAPVEKTIAELGVVTNTAWPIPPTITRRIDEARADLRSAMTLLQSDGISQAATAAETVRSTLMTQLSTEIDKWRDDVSQPLADLKKPIAGVSDAVVSTVTTRLTAAETALTPIKFNDPTAKPDTLLPVLRDLIRARSLVRDALAGLGSALQMEVASGLASLKDLPLPAPAELPRLQTAAGDAAKSLEQLADAPASWPAAGGAPKVALKALHDAWGKALALQVPGQTANLQTLDTQHADRKYLDEVATVIAAFSPAAAAGSSVRQPFAPIALSFSSDPATAIGPASVVHLALPGAGRIPVASPREFLSAKDLAKAKRKQAIFVGALLAVFGYSTYAAAFIGTATEVITIFFWAFSLDVTADALLKLIKKS